MDEIWQRWLQRNADKLTGGYEHEFAATVFPRVPEVVPSDVLPQYGFIDANGTRRYVDFVIKNDAKGYCLPIELDGLAKDETHAKWNAFLQRQNDLVVRVAPPLRFTNAQLHHDVGSVIHRIRDYLRTQAGKHAERCAVRQELVTLREQLDASKAALLESQRRRVDHPAAQRAAADRANAQLEQANRGLERQLADALAHQARLDRETHAALTELEQRAAQAHAELEHQKRESALNVRWFIGGITVVAVAAMAFVTKPFSSPASSVAAPPAIVVAHSNPASSASPPALPSPPASGGDRPAVPPAVAATPNPVAATLQPIESHASPPKARSPAPDARSSSVPSIPVEQSREHIGQQVRTCSSIASVKRFRAGFYLNLGLRYPNQHATLVVWEDVVAPFESRFGPVEQLAGKRICAQGFMNGDRDGRPRIDIRRLDQVSGI